MKKLLLSLFAFAACGIAASANEVTFDFLNNEYGMTRLSGSTSEYNPNPCEITDGSVTITVASTNTYASRLWSDGLRLYKQTTVTITASGADVTEIALTAKSATAAAGLDLSEGEAGSASVSDAVITWTGSATSVEFATNITSGNIAFSEIKVVYGDGGTVDNRKDAGLSFPESSYDAVLGEAFTAPVLTKATTAAVTYSSDATDVATVDATTGAVTLVAAGTAHITATAEANDDYKAGSASYTLTVTDPTLIYSSAAGADFTNIYVENPDELTVDIWSYSSYGYYQGSGYKSSAAHAAVAIGASPVIDLTYASNITLNFAEAFNNYKLNNVMIDVADFNGYAEIVIREEDGEWESLGEPTKPESFTWNFYDNAEISLDAYAGKKVQIGFKYTSTADVAGTWEVKNIRVNGDVNDPNETLLDSPLGEDFTFVDTKGLESVWSTSASYGLVGSGYANSQPNEAEGIAASPVIDLTDYENVTLNFDQAFNNYKLNNVMIDIADFSGYAEIVAREETGEWTELTTPTDPSSSSWTFYANEEISLDAYKGKKMQFGFKYISTDQVAGTWEVKNIVVKGEKNDNSSSVAEIAVEDTNAPVEYYNLQGVRVSEPANGLYIRRQGNTVTKVIIK